MADHYRFMYEHGIRYVGTQASEHFSVNPWNYYAYAELSWHLNKPPGEILDEFFTAYYREYAQPMLAFYRTLADHLIQNDIPLKGTTFFFSYTPTPGAFPRHITSKMEDFLSRAERRAKSWVVKERVAEARKAFQWTLNYIERLRKD